MKLSDVLTPKIGFCLQEKGYFLMKKVIILALMSQMAVSCAPEPVAAVEISAPPTSKDFITELSKQNAYTICATVNFTYEIGDEVNYENALIAMVRANVDPKNKDCFEGSQYGKALADKANRRAK